MTIEVRQLLIKSTVTGTPEAAPGAGDVAAERIERLREDLMVEFKAWVEERLQRARER
jgi:hypothetical protein